MDERVDELTKIKNDLKNNEQLVSEQTTTIQAILMERDDLNNLIQKLSKEKVNQNKLFLGKDITTLEWWYHLNKMYIKFMNLKSRSICKWCYDNKVHKVGFRNILN